MLEGGNICKRKRRGLEIIVSGLESGGGRLKDRTECAGQALREDVKWGSSFSKVTTKKERKKCHLASNMTFFLLL